MIISEWVYKIKFSLIKFTEELFKSLNRLALITASDSTRIKPISSIK